MFLLDWYRNYLELRKEFTICDSCETLKIALEQSNHEKRELLQLVISNNKPIQELPRDDKELKPIRSFVPWSIRKQMLENEDKKTAQLMKEKGITNLEEELEIAEREN
jgi:hypothetical protein